MDPPAPAPADVTCDEPGTDCSYGPVTPDDDNGHGTGVAGIIGASGDNGMGVAGVAWGITPISIKLLDCQPALLSCNSARAFDWARTRGIPILNMSYDTGGFDAAELAAVRNAFYAGQLLVGAVGNDNAFHSVYPAAHAKMVCTVGAYFVNRRRWIDNLISDFVESTKGSNYGPALDLAAPGGALIATTSSGNRQCTNKYGDLSSCTNNFGGTSGAAPVVAGVAALIRSAYSAHGATGTEPLLGEDLYHAMIITARHPDTTLAGAEKAWDDSAGFGHVRADTALKLFASPREIYHKRVTSLAISDTFTSSRTLKNVPGLPSLDSTYTVKTYVMRKTVAFSPPFTGTPMVWARSSGSAGVKDTTTYDYYTEVNTGRIISVTTDSVKVETNIFKIIGVSAPYDWFPLLTAHAAVALTAVGEPSGGGGGGGPAARDEDQRRGHGLPTRFVLHQNRPNPFAGSTRIRFDLPTASQVLLEIFDPQGRLVRTLASSVCEAGFHSIDWDRRANAGRMLGPGIYLCRMQAGSFRGQRKMVLLPR